MNSKSSASYMYAITCLLAVTIMVPATFAQMDHSFINEYNGPTTCTECHEGMIEQLQDTVHYKFESSVPENYLYEHDGVTPEDIERSGKLWKLCGFPTTIPQINWMGRLKDDPETPYVDKPGGCARCHIGIGIKPYTAVGAAEPQESEAHNVDCLICHAENYTRRLYVSKVNGEDELNASGSPVVLTVPRNDGVLDFSPYLDAAKSVQKPKSEYCLRCHASAGGGKYQLDNMYYSFKRGSAFDTEVDVHASFMTCTSCHKASDDNPHESRRPLNNDLYAYDNVAEQQLCLDCHGETPHENTSYNTHAETFSCTACHATTTGGAIEKDFSEVIPPDPNNPLDTYKVKVTLAEPNYIPAFLWFNGTVKEEITPLGSKGDGKIYPYKELYVNQPVDADGNPVPVKWGKIFLAGDVPEGANVGRAQYANIYTEELGAQTGLPPVPGEFDHYQRSECSLFSLSHGITKEKALNCSCCHTENSVLDYAALGYSEDRAQALKSFDFGESCNRFDLSMINDWEILAR